MSTATPDPSPPRIALSPRAGWPTSEGWVADLVVWHQGHTLVSATPVSREEMQDLINKAADTYGIRPECNCYPGGFSPDSYEGPQEHCRVHGREAVGCQCPPCPGKGIDGNGLNHCAECCWGTRVVADIDCPTHGREANR